MDNNDSIQETSIREIFGEVPKRTPMKPKEFKAWHRPRKQFIRKHQWNKYIAKLIPMLLLSERPLKYLTLPGADFLDIRCAHEVCMENKIMLKYLGFTIEDGSDKDEADIISSEIRQLPNIHKDSLVMIDDLRKVADTKSKAYSVANSYGPFDVINLDLCCSIATRQNYSPTYFDSIATLLNLQMLRRTEPWILFLTTLSGPKEVNEQDMSKIWDSISKNLKTHDDFKNELTNLFGHEFSGFETYGEVHDNLGARQFIKLFNIGIGKWILQYMMSESPKCTVEMLSVYCYRTGSYAVPTMLSIVFQFNPIIQPRTDKAHLVNPAFELKPKTIEENELVNKLITSVKSLEDLDIIMQSDMTLFDRMKEESKSLLSITRYPVAEYDLWVKNNSPNVR